MSTPIGTKDSGRESGRESTQDEIKDALARPAALCAFCPKMCRSTCAVSEAEAREAVTPWGKMSLVHLGRTGAARLDTPAAHKALEACTGCGSCVEQCAHGNPVSETLFSARALANTPRAQKHRQNFEQNGDVLGRELWRVLDGIRRDPQASIAYFPGCVRCGKDGRDVIDRDRRALETALDADVPVVDIGAGAQCCGYPLYVDGQLDLVEDNLVRLGERLAGHALVVTPDPGCAYMLSTVRATLVGSRGKSRAFPEVLPLVEVLGRRAERFRGRARGLVVRYHDPCYLARRGRTFDAPRRLLESATGQAPLEFVRHHDDADCSGGGGLYPVSNPEGAKEMAARRVSHDGDAKPGDIVVTACPSSRRSFERAGLIAKDVVDVILGEV